MGVRLGDFVVPFVNRRKIHDLVGHLGFHHLAVGSLDEPEFVESSVGCHRADQTDVRTFRGLDRTDPTVVAGVYVPNLKTGPFPGQAAWPQSGQPPFVGDFRKRVGLVHELRELAGAKKLVDHGTDRFTVDDVVQHHGLGFLEAHALLDRPFHAHQADPHLVFQKLADRANPPVAQVIDVVHVSAGPVFEPQEIAHYGHDVRLGQNRGFQRFFQMQLLVDLHPPNVGEVVPLGVEEHILQKVFGDFQGRRVAGLHLFVDLDHRLLGAGDLVGGQGVSEAGPDGFVAHKQQVHLLDLVFQQAFQNLFGQRHVAFEQHRPVLGLHVLEGVAAQDVVQSRGDFFDAQFLHLADGGPRNLFAFGQDHLLGILGVNDVLNHPLVLGADGIKKLGVNPFVRVFADCRLEVDPLDRVKLTQKFGSRGTQSLEQDGGQELPAPVDPDVQKVFGIKFEVNPRTPLGDDAGRVKQFARAVALALVVAEKDPGGLVQLADDHPLGAVDDEGAGVGHQGELTEVNLLFLDVVDPSLVAFFVHLPDDQPQRNPNWGCEGDPADLAFIFVVLGLAQPVGDVLQGAGAAEVGDREYGLKYRFETLALPLFRGNVLLEEPSV